MPDERRAISAAPHPAPRRHAWIHSRAVADMCCACGREEGDVARAYLGSSVDDALATLAQANAQHNEDGTTHWYAEVRPGDGTYIGYCKQVPEGSRGRLV